MRLMNIMRPKFWIIALPFMTCLGQPAAVAITINMEYTDEGDPVPHDENPTWDPAGVILKAHFQSAKQIWESLLPGEGEYSFDFHWDDDLDPSQLGQYTPGFDEFIEINPINNWFADPTPSDSSEFGVPTQTLYSQILPALQSSHFPGTAPPGALEVGYRAAGTSAINGAGGFNSISGDDLLSTIVHEMGHALGLSGIEPGNYNILPQHVGGLEDVEVLEGGGGHLAGQGNVPYLMCENCGVAGVRRFPTATDILVIADDQGITDVRLARVGRISAGVWGNANAWIGGAVPNATQAAYVRSAAAVTLDVNASVGSLVVAGGGSVVAAGFQLTSAGDIRFDGGALSVGAGGYIRADAIHGDPATLTTVAGSTIGFNNFTRGASSATAATFHGNVHFGVISSGNYATFNPDTITAWTIDQDLRVGVSQPANLVIDNGAWSVGGNLDIKGNIFSATAVVVDGGTLNVNGSVTVRNNGALTYKSQNASNTTYMVSGGAARIETSPQPHLEWDPGAYMFFESTFPAVPVTAASATIDVGGGTGDRAPGGNVTFKGNPTAGDAEFRNSAGIGGLSLYINHPIVIAGTGGRVNFEDDANASSAHFRNDGVDAHGPDGSGGATYFKDDSNASGATFDNYGSTLQSYASREAPGGRTEFFGNASASLGTFYNHPGEGMGSLGAGRHDF